MASRRISTESWIGRRQSAGELARGGHLADATRSLCVLTQQADSPVDQAAAISDLAAIAAASGNRLAAYRGLQRALRRDPGCIAAHRNLSLLRSHQGIDGTPKTDDTSRRPRIAILSLLFNWPSTGGGTVHTKELADVLQANGYDVCHIYLCEGSAGNYFSDCEIPL